MRDQESDGRSLRTPSWLQRLAPGFYRGYANVHWQMTIEHRQTGWLSPEFHLRFREIHLHTLTRYRLICPVYCLMPDHLHLLWMGISENSDQRLGSQFLRKHVNVLLRAVPRPGRRLQRQAFDHVLREDEHPVDPVRALATYILENPRRVQLIREDEVWPYLGAMIPGYPEIHPYDGGFWDRFWRIRSRLIETANTGRVGVEPEPP